MTQEKVHITKQETTQDLIYWCAAIVVYLERMDEPTRTEFTEKMLERICIAVNGSTESQIDGKTISFKAPYRRFSRCR